MKNAETESETEQEGKDITVLHDPHSNLKFRTYPEWRMQHRSSWRLEKASLGMSMYFQDAAFVLFDIESKFLKRSNQPGDMKKTCLAGHSELQAFPLCSTVLLA